MLAIIGTGSRGSDTIISTYKVDENVVIKTLCDVNDVKTTMAMDQIEKELV